MYPPSRHVLQARTPLRGWRARVWSWVLFAALLRALVPHAALAAIATGGNPAAVLCAPRVVAADDALSRVEQASSGHEHCVCASGGDAAPPSAGSLLPAAHSPALPLAHGGPLAVLVAAVSLPPPCGPPA